MRMVVVPSVLCRPRGKSNKNKTRMSLIAIQGDGSSYRGDSSLDCLVAIRFGGYFHFLTRHGDRF